MRRRTIKTRPLRFSGPVPGPAGLVVLVAGAVILAGCNSIPASNQASAAPAEATDQVVVIGDSLSTGYGTRPELAWPVLLQEDYTNAHRPVHITNAAQNGSGYLSVGADEETFESEIAGSVTSTTDLVLLFGSENDMGTDPTTLERTAADAFARIKSAAPRAAIVVVGPPSYTDSPEAERLDVRDAIRSAADAAGASFIDPIADQWIMGQVENLIGPDGDHPSEAGQRYLAAKMAAIVSSLAPLGTGKAS